MDGSFSKNHVVDIDLEASRCVFRLPKTTTQTSPRSYAPRRLGLGPYHHHRTDYKMQLHKITRVRRFLAPHKLHAFEQIVADLLHCEPIVRACYGDVLDFDIMTLARILSVDALYLLQLLDARKNGEISDEMMENVADILMVENQIPVALLKVTLAKVVQPHEIHGPESFLSTAFREFCQAYSPLHLKETRQEWTDREQRHLLDRMYNSIVTNSFDQISLDMHPTANVPVIIGFFGEQTAVPLQIRAIVERAQKIRDQLKEEGGGGGGADEELATAPSAFELSETAGVNFKRTQGGIRDIVYHVDENILQLPCIRLDCNSEIVLRNLVAYEAAAGATVVLAEYVDLMCGLICTEEDVDILKKAEVIVGELSDEEIIAVFEGMGRLIGGGRKKTVEEARKTYDDVGLSVKVKRCVNNKCLSATWRYLVLVAAVGVVALLVMQLFCSVFDCAPSSARRSMAAFQSFQSSLRRSLMFLTSTPTRNFPF